MGGGCYTCIKYLMFAFNFIFWLVGCGLLGLGIWLRVDPNIGQYTDNSEAFKSLYIGAYILIAAGVIVMIIGFLGCCGAIRESQCLLCTFFLFLMVLFVALVGAGVWAIVSQDTLKGIVSDGLKHAVENYKDGGSAKNLMDNVQRNLNCCGWKLGSPDYITAGVLQKPDSCGIVDQNCTDKLFDLVKEHSIIIAGVAIGVALVMLLGMMFSMCLCCAIRRATA